MQNSQVDISKWHFFSPTIFTATSTLDACLASLGLTGILVSNNNQAACAYMSLEESMEHALEIVRVLDVNNQVLPEYKGSDVPLAQWATQFLSFFSLQDVPRVSVFVAGQGIVFHVPPKNYIPPELPKDPSTALEELSEIEFEESLPSSALSFFEGVSKLAQEVELAP